MTVSNPQRSLKSVINVFLYSLSVDSVVAQVVAQALASLEGQVKGSVKDYVVKVSPVIFPHLLLLLTMLSRSPLDYWNGWRPRRS